MEKDVALTKNHQAHDLAHLEGFAKFRTEAGCCGMRALKTEDRVCFYCMFPSSVLNTHTSAADQSKPWALFTAKRVKSLHSLRHSHPLWVIPHGGGLLPNTGQLKR